LGGKIRSSASAAVATSATARSSPVTVVLSEAKDLMAIADDMLVDPS
jgi:hypothetical protein